MEAFPFRALDQSQPYDAIRRLPVAVGLDCVRSIHNVGAFFRTCDAVGAECLYLCGYTGGPPHPGLAKTALGAEHSLPWERRDTSLDLIAELRGLGWRTAAVETSPRAVDLFDWRPSFPVCLLFGNEVEGLGADVVEAVDEHVRIPMLGVKQSLNVSVAGGVVLFEALRQFRLLSNRP